jgi:hypothetical protein
MPTPLACRFCEHPVSDHNDIEGCPFCRCAGNQREVEPRTLAEDLQPIRSRETVKPGYERRPTRLPLVAYPVREKVTTKTGARKALADARRSLATASNMLDRPHASVVAAGISTMPIENRQRVMVAHLRDALAAIESLDAYDIVDR